MTEYADKGLFGLLTPQANTTAELEVQILCPPGTAALTARLTSDRPTMEDRLIDYVARMEDTIARFANAPLTAVGFACTGASYLVDPEEEARRLDAIAEARGVPVVTAANAIADALAELGARRIGIVSPYDDELHEAGMRYWAARGFEIGPVERLAGKDAAFHPIYALPGNASAAALAAIDAGEVDAIVILGTGLATLGTLLEHAQPVPVLTPNLALAWRLLATVEATPLAPWLDGSAWADRYRARLP
ncbi:MAG: maleate cis-trans isomerase family protein [Pseudooceanicola nanhaiensis]